jgi:hypothetical protein
LVATIRPTADKPASCPACGGGPGPGIKTSQSSPSASGRSKLSACGSTPDFTTALQDLANMPADITNAFLNGYGDVDLP